MGKIESFKDLRVWQEGMMLVEQVYRKTSQFPPEERFGLTSQARRAAVSIPANIAEGWGRETTADYLHFLVMARGSLMELETHLIIVARLGLLNDTALKSLQTQIATTGKSLNALISSLKNRRQPPGQ